jgi:superfamily II DNA or RNA helicase/HKD family nuclease
MNYSLEQSLKAGFINYQSPANNEYLPQFLVNDKIENKKILSTILHELNTCDEFWFSVAFVTTSGIAALIETLITLKNKGIKGKILVSQYLNFTQPEALKRLLKFENIELKIAVDNEFHSKGYLFRKKNIYNLIIGSSNLTANALCSNVEWNLKISANDNSYIILNALKEFDSEYKKSVFVTQEFINSYFNLYQQQFELSRALKNQVELTGNQNITPNSMQQEALKRIEKIRLENKNKALLISATGTGKTYLSAFDVKRVNPKKFLFVVHRLNIAKAAQKAYQNIFGKSKSMGVFSGNVKDVEADFIFSTIQTISKEDNLRLFKPEEFEYIVIDETHRASADSYQSILNYFNPKFLLGMTATPERTDGLDVFKLFDYNIAYEIRLHKALEENILSSFHYYGVTDITVDGKVLEENADFKLLTSDERIDKIIEKSQLYGCDDGNVRGLIFCSKIDEAIELSKGFNKRGLKTITLSAINTEQERATAIEKLESDIKELDYIFTVDIFNEGIDIPRVNQIIMLRPTQSAIIFVQQLGRGLRKIVDKDYLTVIDFIGNYQNNFLVPIALFGDSSYNKDKLRKLLTSGSNQIPGASTINFDKIAKEKIFNAIDTANMQRLRDLDNDYKLLKFKIGRIPMMVDFLEQGGRDPFLFVKQSKSYFNYTLRHESQLINSLTKEENKLLELFSNEINNSKRVEESIILENILKNNRISILEFKNIIKLKYEYECSDDDVASCLNNLNFGFVRNERAIVSVVENEIIIGNGLKNAIKNRTFLTFLQDNINYAIKHYDSIYNKKSFINGFIRYNKYTRKDVCRILNWPNDISSTVYGYRTNNKKTPCFVTYHKSNDISENTKYNDYFIDQYTFAWESRSNRRIESLEIKNLIESDRILLFVKKEDDEGFEFYFIGDVKIKEGSIRQSAMGKTNAPVVQFDFILDKPVEPQIFEYLTTKHLGEGIVNTMERILPFKVLDFDNEKLPSNAIPLINLMAAAGEFSNLQNIEVESWIQLNKEFNYKPGYFVCQVIGDSMNKIIPNGSWCLFKEDSGGSRNGKVVLVYRRDYVDSDFGNGYTVKLYESEKVTIGDSWSHSKIILKTQSLDKDYKDLVLQNEALTEFKVVGEFVEVLK